MVEGEEKKYEMIETEKKDIQSATILCTCGVSSVVTLFSVNSPCPIRDGKTGQALGFAQSSAASRVMGNEGKAQCRRYSFKGYDIDSTSPSASRVTSRPELAVRSTRLAAWIA
jgi:hypothetical protein